jgi:predicted RNase H-like nuclease (RuvC/YqgF family)
MNALTKLLVVLVLLLSFGFAVSQIVLYNRRENYGALLEEAKTRLDTVQRDLAQAKLNLEDTQDTLALTKTTLEDKVQRLTDALEDEKDLVQAKTEQLNRESTSVASLTEFSRGLNDQIASLRVTLDEQGDSIEALNATINEQQVAIGDLRSTVSERDATITGLELDLEDAKKANTFLAESNARLEGIVLEFKNRGFEVPPAPPPAIDAIVVRVDQIDEEHATAVIDKGAADDVKPNTQFTIYRHTGDDKGFVATLVIHDVWEQVAGGLLTRQVPGKQAKAGDRATTTIQVR